MVRIMNPLNKIKSRLEGRIPEHIINNLPSGWYKLGEALILDLSSINEIYRNEVAEAYMKVLNGKSVLNKSHISGEYRKPNFEHIIGEKNPIVKHKENGVTYNFNPRKIMFSPSNESERKRMKNKKIETEETLVDMFAGVGHLSIPLTLGPNQKNKRIVELHAIEKNNYTYKFLNKSIESNNINNYYTYNLDCRKFPKKDFADRILMGYVRKTHHYLKEAFRIMKPIGTIHYHETVPEQIMYKRPIKRLKRIAAQKKYRIKEYNIEVVKKYSPGVWHIVVDANVEKK